MSQVVKKQSLLLQNDTMQLEIAPINPQDKFGSDTPHNVIVYDQNGKLVKKVYCKSYDEAKAIVKEVISKVKIC